MIEHLGINTPYFGILLSVIPFLIATYFFKKTNGFAGAFIRQYGLRYCLLESNRNQLRKL